MISWFGESDEFDVFDEMNNEQWNFEDLKNSRSDDLMRMKMKDEKS
jgi:hypothetical protein